MDAQAIKSLMGGIAPVISEYVERATAPLIEQNKSLSERNSALESRIVLLEAREIPELPDMSESIEQVAEILRGMQSVEERLDEGETRLRELSERPEIDMDGIRQFIIEAVAELPPPEPGRKGDDCDMEAVARMVAERVDEVMAQIPPAKDGIGLSDALRGKDGNLILIMTDGTKRDLGPIDGKNGETFTLDDFDIEALDERTICMKFTKGNEAHSFELEFPVPVYRGVWKQGEYVRGDVVTWGGCMWHADETTTDKPDEKGWTQCVKKGRDGRPTDVPGMKVLIREVLAEEGGNK